MACALAEELSEARHLVGLYIDQEQVRGPGSHVEGKVTQQVRLNTADPDDEERTEADRQQHHARLIPRTVQPEDGVADGEGACPRKGCRRSNERPARHVQHERNHREAAAHGRPDPPRPGLPTRERHERRTDQQGDDRAEPVAATRSPVLLPEQQ